MQAVQLVRVSGSRRFLSQHLSYSMSTKAALRSVSNKLLRSPSVPGEFSRRAYTYAPALVCPLVTVLAELDRVARCEAPPLVTRQTRRRILAHEKEPEPEISNDLLDRLRKLRGKARRGLRMVARAAQLLLTFAPLAALYPVAKILKSLGFGGKDSQKLETALNGEADDSSIAEWYLNLCLRCVENSGAAVIKLMQWASSRPDMFGDRFCQVFGKLQDSTTPHAWKYTEEILRKAYGEEWKETIRLDKTSKILGSGCIGQVYAGVVEDLEGVEQNVAVKVMHPGVKNNIDADLDLLAFFANIAEHAPFGIGKQLMWLDLPGVVEEFHRLLIHQLDFRTEAENLVRFNENFKDDKDVLFPKLIPGFDPCEEILVETFCDGIPFWRWNELNMENRELRTKMCHTGVRTICQMIFNHNFIHGDLHPGNIFCSPDGSKFILLDTGMASEYDDDDHDRIISILTAFIRMDGQKAGELLIKDSNARTRDDDKVLHEQEYIAKIKELTDECKYNEDVYLMQKLGEYISRMFDAAQKHHVLMNPAFVSCSLAVKVVEGVALALDPDAEIWRIANPIILQSEIQHNAKKLGNKLSLDKMVNKVKGEAELLKKKIKYYNIEKGKHNPEGGT